MFSDGSTGLWTKRKHPWNPHLTPASPGPKIPQDYSSGGASKVRGVEWEVQLLVYSLASMPSSYMLPSLLFLPAIPSTCLGPSGQQRLLTQGAICLFLSGFLELSHSQNPILHTSPFSPEIQSCPVPSP